MAQQEYRNPAPRRSSIIAKQFAEEEGVEVTNISDLFRALPPNVQEQVARQSNSRRSSNLAQNPIHPTPMNSAKGKTGRFGSGIPVLSNSARRNSQNDFPIRKKTESASKVNAESAFRRRTAYLPNNTSNVGQSANRPPKLPILNTTKNLSAARQKMGSIQNLNHTKNSSISFMRSMSMESLRDTPCGLTPGWRTPGTSNPVRNSEKSKYPAAKSIKPPNSTDRKTLNGMALHINEFIQSKNYSRLMTLKEFFSMPSNEYINICVFVGSLMMGPSYFPKTDPLNKIFDLSKLLKYPGTITKSHLKVANIPQSWPYTLTFLSWLCDRVEMAISPDVSHKPISEISQNDYKELAAESYLVLFLQELNTGEQDPDLLEAELQAYKSKLQERYMSDIPQSIEELKAIRDAEIEKLNILENTPNPAQSLIDAQTTYEKVLQDTKNKLKESKEKMERYKDLASLHAHRKALNSKFHEKEKEIQTIQNIISNQPFNKIQQLKMMEEMETYKNQIQTIETITKKLGHQVTSTKVTKTNLEKKFYEICTRFTVIESFQQAVRRLRLDVPTVPPNPLEPSSLKQWIIEVEKIQLIASKKISALHNEIQEKLTKMERNKKQRQQQLLTFETQRVDLESKLKTMGAKSECSKKEREIQLAEVIETEKEISEEIALLKNETTAMTETLTNLNVACAEFRKKFEEEQSSEDAWRDRAEDLTIGLMEEGTIMSNFLDKYCVNRMAELREIRIRNNLDVSLYDGLLEEYAEAGIYPGPAEN